MNSQFVPMTLGDIFEKSVSLIGKTFLRNLLIVFAFLSIPLMLMAIAATDFYSSIADIQRQVAEAEQEGAFDEIISLMGSLSLFLFATLIFGGAAAFIGILLAIITAATGGGVSGVLTLLIAPVYTVVLYYDLRARQIPIKVAPAAGTAEGPQEPLDFDKL